MWMSLQLEIGCINPTCKVDAPNKALPVTIWAKNWTCNVLWTHELNVWIKADMFGKDNRWLLRRTLITTLKHVDAIVWVSLLSAQIHWFDFKAI